MFKLLQIVITAHSSSVTNVLSPILFGFLCPVNIPRPQFSKQSNKTVAAYLFFFQKSQCVPPSAPFTRLGGKQGLGLAPRQVVVHTVGFGGKHSGEKAARTATTSPRRFSHGSMPAVTPRTYFSHKIQSRSISFVYFLLLGTCKSETR